MKKASPEPSPNSRSWDDQLVHLGGILILVKARVRRDRVRNAIVGGADQRAQHRGFLVRAHLHAGLDRSQSHRCREVRVERYVRHERHANQRHTNQGCEDHAPLPKASLESGPTRLLSRIPKREPAENSRMVGIRRIFCGCGSRDTPFRGRRTKGDPGSGDPGLSEARPALIAAPPPAGSIACLLEPQPEMAGGSTSLYSSVILPSRGPRPRSSGMRNSGTPQGYRGASARRFA